MMLDTVRAKHGAKRNLMQRIKQLAAPAE